MKFWTSHVHKNKCRVNHAIIQNKNCWLN